MKEKTTNTVSTIIFKMSDGNGYDDDQEYIRDPILDTEEMRKMFVGGIAKGTTDDELKDFFISNFDSSLTDGVVMKKDSDKVTHFGFVTFETSEMLDDVLLQKDNLNFKGRNLDVNRAIPKNNANPSAKEKTKKLFVANLPYTDCEEDELREYLEARHPKKYGTIESIQFVKKKDDQGNKLEENKGYGFVEVSNEDLADKMAIQHATFEFKGRKVEMKKSVPHSAGRGGGGGRGGGAAAYGGYGAGGYDAYSYGDPYGYGQGYGQGYGYGGYGAGGYGGGGYGGGYGQQGQQQKAGRGRGRYQPY